jgi:GNAT superfamily N-acetyltransferase
VITIRPAMPADIAAMSAVLTASIRDLCAADHGNDPEILAGWLRNKSPDGVTKMLANPDATLFVAELDGTIAAVGAVAADGSIGLNYVDPACRFRGLSKALLGFMEQVLAQRGFTTGRLVSTRTAHRFYRAAGWHDDGAPERLFDLDSYPMVKALTA